VAVIVEALPRLIDESLQSIYAPRLIRDLCHQRTKSAIRILSQFRVLFVNRFVEARPQRPIRGTVSIELFPAFIFVGKRAAKLLILARRLI
jgi:hypothetical protein